MNNLLLPVLRQQFGPGTIAPTEGLVEELAVYLDIHAKIDAIFVTEAGIAYGLYFRMTNGTWDNLTISNNHYHDLVVRWNMQPALMPAVLVQGYVILDSSGRRVLRRVIAVKSSQFLPWSFDHPGRTISHRSGSGIFLSLPFDELFAAGISEFLIPVPSLQSSI